MAHSRVERTFLYVFLAFLVAACLVITPYAGINEAKWFLIRLGGPLLAVGWVVFRVVYGGLRRRWDIFSSLALAMLIGPVLSLVGAQNQWLAALGISNQVALLAVFFYVSTAAKYREDRDKFLWAASLIGIATALYGVAQHFGFDFFSWQEHYQVPISRGVSFFGHATFSASVLIIAIPLGAGLASNRRSRVTRFVLYVGLALMMMHLFYSGARAAVLSLFAASLAAASIFLFFRRGEEGKRRRLFVAGVYAVVTLVGGALAVQAWRVKDSDLFAVEQKSGLLRLYAWETSSRIFFENPVFGIGLGNYEVSSMAYWNEFEIAQYARAGTAMHQTHNEYLEVAAEQGIVGVTMLLGLIVYGLMAGLECYGRCDAEDRPVALALFAAVCAASIDAMFIFNFQLPGSALLFWLVLGLTSGLLRSQRAHVVAGVAGPEERFEHVPL